MDIAQDNPRNRGEGYTIVRAPMGGSNGSSCIEASSLLMHAAPDWPLLC